MPQLRRHNGIRILVAIWAVLWMATSAPCVVAGDLDGARADQTCCVYGDHSAPADDASGALLCLNACNQVAVGQDPPDLPSALLPGLTEAPTALAASGLLLPPSALVRTTGPLPYRAPTYLLNQSFLI